MEALIARQAILNGDLEVLGYELLFRDPESGECAITDGDQATSAVIRNALLEIGLPTVVGQVPAFLNVTRQFLLWDNPVLFTRHEVVFEIVDAECDDPPLIEALMRLEALGYRFSADLEPDVDPDSPLLRHLTYAKLRIGFVSDALRALLEDLDARGVTCIATHVETHEQFTRARDLGFHGFQGFFMHRPEDVRGRRLPQSKIATLQLLSRLHDPEVDINDVTDIVTSDPGLSHRVLQIAGTALYGASRVDSIDQAIMRIGLKQLREWLTMLSLSAVDDRPSEILTTALLRAKMCQQLASHDPDADPSQFFTAGLLSMIDALMNAPMRDVLAGLPLSDDLTSAILEGSGSAGSVLTAVKAHLAGDWESVPPTGLRPTDVSEAWLCALQWVEQARVALTRPVPA